MDSIGNIIMLLNPIRTLNGELLYNFSEFYRQLNNYYCEYVGIYDCILTPYYVHGNKWFELYEFELNIRQVEKFDFEKYLLKKTGRTKLKDVPKEVRILHEHCYIEILETENKISKKRLQKYIEFLFSNDHLKCRVQQVFSSFEVEGLFFEFY